MKIKVSIRKLTFRSASAFLLVMTGCAEVDSPAPLQDEASLNAVAQASCSNSRADKVATIKLAHGLYGSWGCMDLCPAGSYAYSFSVKSEGYQGGGIDNGNDDSALNGVTLNCRNKSSGASAGTVSSTVGIYGTAGIASDASTALTRPIVGGALKFESSQGAEDDSGANDVMFSVKKLSSTESTKFLSARTLTGWGAWQEHKLCPSGSAVCGIQTRVEGSQSGGDDTGLNGIQLACCTF